MAIFQNQKHIFWQALVLTIIIFSFGVYLGIWIENGRANKIANLYLVSELNLLDVKLANTIYFNDFLEAKDCQAAIQENIDFANRIYNEAKILDKYEGASVITDTIRLQHKKYDMLRALFWMNAIKIKENCNASYHDIVYFYQYNNASLEKRAEQGVISRALADLKKEIGNEIMLIPIAGDNNISSISLLMKKYNITELPSVLIDEKVILIGLENKEQIKKYLD